MKYFPGGQKMNEPKKLSSVGELAAYLDVPVSWVYGRTREKGPDTIPRIQCGKYIRFEISSVLRWLKQIQEIGSN